MARDDGSSSKQDLLKLYCTAGAGACYSVDDIKDAPTQGGAYAFDVSLLTGSGDSYDIVRIHGRRSFRFRVVARGDDFVVLDLPPSEPVDP